jgi:type VII secretion protein EccB
MPSTPTTKSQVQAYRFVLRRMESALVRKDPVMLHDPMRSHTRATVVGAIVGVVGLVGFLVFGVLKPAPTVPNSGIVIGQPSGSIYVVDQNPHQLIPVWNLASARLLLAAGQQQQQSQGGASGQSQQSAPQLANPTTVDDSQLKNMPMGRLTGIPDGPTMLPGPDQQATTWAVCDQIPRDPNAPQETGHKLPTTMVLVGQSNIGANLPAGQALLVSDDNGATLYLVYAQSGSNDSAVRAQLDQGDQAVLATFGITNSNSYRVVSQAVLDAIPPAPEIQNPTHDMNLQATPDPRLAGENLAMGESFAVEQVNAPTRYYIVVPGGMQQVSQTTAQIAVDENSNGRTNIPNVQPSALNGVHTVQYGDPQGLQVNVTQYPGVQPSVVSADTRPVMCLGWNANFTDPQKPVAKTRVTIGFTMRLPTDPTNGQPMTPITIGQGTSSGQINQFFMNPALGGVAIHGATNASEFGSGPIYVIDPRGVKFSVPDQFTAEVLGVADSSGYLPPAPNQIVSLLPGGGQQLDTQTVQKTFDGMSLNNVGQFLEPTTQNAGGN